MCLKINRVQPIHSPLSQNLCTAENPSLLFHHETLFSRASRQALQNLAALQSQFLICENQSRNLDGSGVRCIAISFASLLRDFLYSLLHNYAMSLAPASGKMPPSRTREDVSGRRICFFLLSPRWRLRTQPGRRQQLQSSAPRGISTPCAANPRSCWRSCGKCPREATCTIIWRERSTRKA